MIDHAVDSWILNLEAPGLIRAWSELFIFAYPPILDLLYPITQQASGILTPFQLVG